MFERFTDRSRRVMVLAREEARLMGSPVIGTEHLFLALLISGRGVAAQVLDGLGVGIDTARDLVAGQVASDERTTGPPPFTNRAKKALELSLRAALSLGDDSIDTEHILLGILDADPDESVVNHVLAQFGVTPELTRAAVFETLEETRLSRASVHSGDPAQQPRTARVDLSGADLSGAKMVGANLSRVDFSEANLAGADLSETLLLGTVFRGTDLTAANLHGAAVAGADFTGATLTNVRSGGLKGSAAILPDGWKIEDGELVGPGDD